MGTALPALIFLQGLTPKFDPQKIPRDGEQWRLLKWIPFEQNLRMSGKGLALLTRRHETSRAIPKSDTLLVLFRRKPLDASKKLLAIAPLCGLFCNVQDFKLLLTFSSPRHAFELSVSRLHLTMQLEALEDQGKCGTRWRRLPLCSCELRVAPPKDPNRTLTVRDCRLPGSCDRAVLVMKGSLEGL